MFLARVIKKRHLRGDGVTIRKNALIRGMAARCQRWRASLAVRRASVRQSCRYRCLPIKPPLVYPIRARWFAIRLAAVALAAHCLQVIQIVVRFSIGPGRVNVVDGEV
jgi:hypothetical protein